MIEQLEKCVIRSVMDVLITQEVGLGRASDQFAHVFSQSFGLGTDNGEIRYIFKDRRQFTTNETLNIEDGSLLDPFGQPVEMQKIKAVRIVNRHATANLDFEQGALMLAAGDRFRVRPRGGMFEWVWSEGVATVGADTFTMIASDADYDIIVLGS